MRRIKTKDIAVCRSDKKMEQSGLCALCNEPIQDTGVLDHDHQTGEIRGVLHRGCNALEGVIKNNEARNLITPERLAAFLSNLIQYRETASTGLLHPTYLTPEEKKEKAKRRTARRRKHNDK